MKIFQYEKILIIILKILLLSSFFSALIFLAFRWLENESVYKDEFLANNFLIISILSIVFSITFTFINTFSLSNHKRNLFIKKYLFQVPIILGISASFLIFGTNALKPENSPYFIKNMMTEKVKEELKFHIGAIFSDMATGGTVMSENMNDGVEGIYFRDSKVLGKTEFYNPLEENLWNGQLIDNKESIRIFEKDQLKDIPEDTSFIPINETLVSAFSSDQDIAVTILSRGYAENGKFKEDECYYIYSEFVVDKGYEIKEKVNPKKYKICGLSFKLDAIRHIGEEDFTLKYFITKDNSNDKNNVYLQVGPLNSNLYFEDFCMESKYENIPKSSYFSKLEWQKTDTLNFEKLGFSEIKQGSCKDNL